MNLRSLFLPLCILSSGLPALAQRENPPGIAATERQVFSSALKLEIVVMEGNAVLAKGTIQGDFDQLKEFEGATRLRFAGGERWSVDASIQLAYEKAEHSSGRPAMIAVDVCDLAQLRAPSGESNTVLPLQIFSTRLSYRGSGSYLLFSDGEMKVTMNVLHQ